MDVFDVSLVTGAYGTTRGVAGFDARGDFNQDDAVDGGDVALLQANLSRRGDILVGVGAAGQKTSLDMLDTLRLESQAADGVVSLRLEPSQVEAGLDRTFTVAVVADAGEQPVDALALYLDYDPQILRMVNTEGGLAGSIRPGLALPRVFLNRVDPLRGHADFLASSLGAAPAEGEFVAAWLRFRAVVPGRATVRFSFSNWRATEAVHGAESVLSGVVAMSVAVDHRASLPLVVKE